MTYLEWLEKQPVEDKVQMAYLEGRASFRDEVIAKLTPPAGIEKIDGYAYRVCMSLVKVVRNMK